MGTEYAYDFGNPAVAARSELGVGRFGIPVAYDLDDQFSIGATLDFVWAGMDLQMAMPGQMLGMMMDPRSTRNTAPGSATGTMVQGLMQAVQGGMLPMPSSARFNFSNDNDFTGAATGTGMAAKVGGLYNLSDKIKLGFAYHFKSNMSDLDASDASVSMEIPGMGSMAVPGSISVRDFQWPAMIAAGASIKFSDSLTVAMDVKKVHWADVMKDFNMTFTAANNLPGMLAGFSGSQMNATLYQDWDNQSVFSIGAAYKVTPALTLRAGLNIADNPIPDSRVNYLFPAISKDHYSIGAGYEFGNGHVIDFAFVYAQEVNVTNPGSPLTTADDMPISPQASVTGAG
jgi:long-chain fatty acid transport protein